MSILSDLLSITRNSAKLTCEVLSSVEQGLTQATQELEAKRLRREATSKRVGGLDLDKVIANHPELMKRLAEAKAKKNAEKKS